VENFVLNLVGAASGGLSYVLVLGVLLACGMGLPLPEDITLIAGGIAVYKEVASLYPMMAVGYLGIIMGDSMIFYFGRRIGSKVGSKPGFFSRIVTPEKRERVEGLFKKHGEKIIMIARFLPGVRSVTYFTAGSVGMKYSHFIFFDSVAALASAPAFVYLGFKFGDKLDYLIAQLRRGQAGVWVAMLVVLVLGLVLSRWRAAREAKANAEALRLKQLDAAPQPQPQPVDAQR
jgi:membrane protein DedA with SNARE-associated domain